MTRAKTVSSRAVEVGQRAIEKKPVTPIDQFDDENLTGWSGSTGNFAFNTTDPIQGAAGLECSTDASTITSQPGGGLSNYFSKGQICHIYVRSDTVGVSSNVIQRIRYGRADSNNFYQVQINWDDTDNWTLFTKSAGSFTVIDEDATITGDLSASNYYLIQIVWDDGTLGGVDNDHTATLFDARTLTQKSQIGGNNSDHATQSGVALSADLNTAATLDWDDWRITS